MAAFNAMDCPAIIKYNRDQMWQHLINAMHCPAIKGSKGDQMWQYTVQWMVQLLKVARGPHVAACSVMDGPAIIGSKGDQN